MDHISNSPEETEDLAKKFLSKNPDANLIGLSGDLGSGKTAFVKGLAKCLGIEQSITSPTFVIEKIYQGDNRRLIHIDAYRLSSKDDLEAIGFDEFLSDSQNIITIEWPEQVLTPFPENMRIIKFNYIDENKRKISW
ncbi:MAG: tRNA (adenosine(37)-N6)-threonylcarbamoyltransferase complex ATPase subunit type 1 TsaE [Candidatus Berkelbacteria bacterium]|nr:tRNA (adenosine(37)-N6)-threonylcarbamoyltransferase complex ATPase subunit type 1 TsaE [Candidatus Berkelbacteria bacterium]